MNTITSRQNPIVGAFRDLADSPDHSGQRLLLDGVHLVRDARQAGLEFEVAAVTENHLADASEQHAAVEALRADGVEVLSVTTNVMQAMSPVRTPSGIVAIVRRPASSLDEIAAFERGLLVVVTDVQDPGNLGSLVRAAEAGGARGVIVCGTSAHPFGWKALRGSMGSTLRIPVVGGVAVEKAIHTLAARGIDTVAAVARDGENADAMAWPPRAAIVLGGEGAGLAEHVAASCDRRVTIAMAAPVESLNVAVAAALLVYAARRQHPIP